MINFVPDIATLQKIASAEDAIFIVQDTTVNKAFRWIENGSSLTADGVDILTTRRGGNTRWLSLSAIGSALTGFVSGADSAISATDTVLQAFAKTQGQKTPLRNLALRYAKLSDTKSAGTAGGTFGSGSCKRGH
mgnify:CR=1 FL=1